MQHEFIGSSDEEAGQEEGEEAGEGQEHAGGEPAHAQRHRRLHRIPVNLQNFLQLLVPAGDAVRRREAPASNEDLVGILERSETISKDGRVKQALLLCPRNLFVPAEQQDEAWVDGPIHYAAGGFNISAPHIHGTILEELDLQPGDRFLDVGCGSGLITAAGAWLVGSTGSVVAMDIRKAALNMAQAGIQQLLDTSTQYKETAVPVTWCCHNAFIPSKRFVGKFNKVCVGAACPPDRLHDICQLLCPEGGKLVAPVDSRMLVVKRQPGSKQQYTSRMLAHVRFSDLEVPRDAEVVLALLAEESAEGLVLEVPPSTYNKDLAELGACSFTEKSPSEEASPVPQVDESHLRPSSRGAQTSRPREEAGPRSSSPSSPKRHRTDADQQAEAQPAYLAAATHMLPSLGPADCFIYGLDPAGTGTKEAVTTGTAPEVPSAVIFSAHSETEGTNGAEVATFVAWRLPAHRRVLQARCEHFRAQFSSGMRDAHELELAAPDGVSEGAVRCLLRYAYTDTGVEDVPLGQVCEVLHVAAYYGTPRLGALCAERLAAVLTSAEEGAVEAAPQLLAFAEETGLQQLKNVALDYIVDHHAAVSQSEAFKALPRSALEDVIARACSHTALVMSCLRSMAGSRNNKLSGIVGSNVDELL